MFTASIFIDASSSLLSNRPSTAPSSLVTTFSEACAILINNKLVKAVFTPDPAGDIVLGEIDNDKSNPNDDKSQKIKFRALSFKKRLIASNPPPSTSHFLLGRLMLALRNFFILNHR